MSSNGGRTASINSNGDNRDGGMSLIDGDVPAARSEIDGMDKLVDGQETSNQPTVTNENKSLEETHDPSTSILSTLSITHSNSSVRRSTHWSQFVALDSYIAKLELGSDATTTATTPPPATSSTLQPSARPSFTLIIIDPTQVTACQHSSSAEVSCQLSASLEKVAHDSLKSMNMTGECLAYLICNVDDDPPGKGRLQSFRQLLQLFPQHSNLGVGIMLSSVEQVERKVHALVTFHGRNSACGSIILGDHFRPIGSSFSEDPSIFGKLYYVKEHNLVNLNTLTHPSAPLASVNATTLRQDLPSSRSSISPYNQELSSLGSQPQSFPNSAGSLATELDSESVSHSDTTFAHHSQSNSTRQLEPRVAIWRQNPPPCHNFYLSPAGCPHGTSCKFGHDYILTGRDFTDLRSSVQRMPCDSVKEGSHNKPCASGEECLYGHTCPYDEKCAWNRCKFGTIAHPKRNANAQNNKNNNNNNNTSSIHNNNGSLYHPHMIPSGSSIVSSE